MWFNQCPEIWAMGTCFFSSTLEWRSRKRGGSLSHPYISHWASEVSLSSRIILPATVKIPGPFFKISDSSYFPPPSQYWLQDELIVDNLWFETHCSKKEREKGRKMLFQNAHCNKYMTSIIFLKNQQHMSLLMLLSALCVSVCFSVTWIKILRLL